MIIFEFIIFSLVLIALSLIAGYYVGRASVIEEYKPRKEGPRETIGSFFETEVERHLKAPDHSEDAINHEGVGIIYRPTSDELAKMNESETTKQAKAAIAETLSKEVPPEV